MDSRLTRRDLLHTAGALLLGSSPLVRSFWLFPLLKPSQVKIRSLGISRLHCVNSSQAWILEGPATAEATLESTPLQISGPSHTSAWSELELPGGLRRSFYGTLNIRPGDGALLVVLTTPIEVATNCIIGAELPLSQAAPEALAAQAIVSRSILCAAHPRHTAAHFCDTTHCQFFRSPSPPGTPAACSVERTSGLLLTQAGVPFVPRYSAACGGHTESGFDGSVHYQAVVCEPCLRAGRQRRGHGWGLCQEGAMDLAQSGVSYQGILRTYYPNSALARWL